MQDVATRQRNVVFPDTVQNEARFWRNFGNQSWTTPTKVGLGLLALFVFGTAASVLVNLILYDSAWKQEVLDVVALTLLVFGPIFGLVVWAVPRNLKKLHHPSASQRFPARRSGHN
jgi:hypothetical protein